MTTRASTVGNDHNEEEEEEDDDMSNANVMEDVIVDPYAEKILWSAISRNNTILAEAGEDPFDGAVSQAAHGILAKKPTPGWEYFTLKVAGESSSLSTNHWFGGGRSNATTTGAAAAGTGGNRTFSWKKDKNPGATATDASTNTNKSKQEEDSSIPRRIPKLKAIKFHVYEHNGGEDNKDYENNNNNHNNNNNNTKNQEPTIWVFSAVYNPEATTWENKRHVLSDVQSFLEKIVGLTELPRSQDPVWRTGSTLACQATFASILLQRMQEVTYLGTMARLTESLDGVTHLMHENITAILQRQEQLDELHHQSSQLNDMASVFKKKTIGLRRRMMMQNAKHGIILGTCITAGVAVCIVPPLVAIL